MEENGKNHLSKAYEVVTNKIIEMLKVGTVPWRKPWKGGEAALPRALVSGKPYRGINVFLLTTTAQVAGYTSPYWLTFKQALERGGHVRKGEKSTPIVFWKILDRLPYQHPKSEDEDDDEEAVEGKRKVPFLKFYSAFNVEQCDNIAYPRVEAPANTFSPLEQCEAIVRRMPNPPTIRHQEPRAFYRPAIDTINMPKPELFESSEEYYSTLFHEMIHATGHASRLDRKSLSEMAPFGSESYAKEELIAEMGAAFLCGHGGIEPATLQNSAAYLDGWLKKLRDDPKMIVLAAASAQKATDYVLGADGQRPSANQTLPEIHEAARVAARGA